jgi:hypothetical protein
LQSLLPARSLQPDHPKREVRVGAAVKARSV